MLDLIFTPVAADGFTGVNYLICTAASLILGAVIAASVAFRSRTSRSFLLTLVILPAAVQTVIMLVNGSVGTGLAVMGAFSLVRFRSIPGTAREISAIILAMAAGLACAQGYVGMALLFTVVTCAIFLIFSFVGILGRGEKKELHVTVPESLNYSHVFDDIFEKYASGVRLISVKTTNMGSLFKLKYELSVKDPDSEKNMIDEMRCRNGNLEILICDSADAREVL